MLAFIYRCALYTYFYEANKDYYYYYYDPYSSWSDITFIVSIGVDVCTNFIPSE